MTRGEPEALFALRAAIRCPSHAEPHEHGIGAGEQRVVDFRPPTAGEVVVDGISSRHPVPFQAGLRSEGA